jgi:predicted transcriptional regulator
MAARKKTTSTKRTVNKATVKKQPTQKERAAYKYDAKFHDPWVFSLALKGATDEEIAEAMGISRMTVSRWSTTTNDKGESVLTSFGEQRRNGKEIADGMVVTKLYERCVGYEVEEEEKVVYVRKDGSSHIGEIRTRTRHIMPDTLAMMYWLNNRHRKTGEWSQKQEITHSFGEEQQDVIIVLPDNGRDKSVK